MRNIVESGEEMRFENEEIHFKNSLTIEGSVVYENCKIFCYEDGCEASIDLEGEGELTFRGCEIVFCGAKGDNEYFIDNDDGTLELADCRCSTPITLRRVPSPQSWTCAGANF